MALRRSVAALALLSLTAVAGCTDAQRQVGTSRQPDTTPPGGAVQSPAAGTYLAVAGIPLGDDSPFAPYLPFVKGPPQDAAVSAAADQRARERQDRVEADIAKCMKGRGFDYYPVEWVKDDPVRLFPGGDVMELPRLPLTRDETERIGYGVEPPGDLAGAVAESNQMNIEYLTSLDLNGRQEYDLALNGPNPYEPVPQAAAKGCAEIAIEANPVDGSQWSASPQDQFDSQFSGLGRAMADIVYAAVRGDPAVASLNRRWASCMDDKGYDLGSGNLYDESQVEPWTAYTLALRTRADGSLGETWYTYSSENETPEDERSLSGSPAEIQIAVDDFDCRGETDYEATYRAVQLRLEAEFVAANKEQMDAMAAFTAAQG
ncbi:MAG: hypothetical protein LBU05_04050 [Bifidobacteriaceae bacterium]|nr:hypothetical protein [Bifidobacteriaceae bacterium]